MEKIKTISTYCDSKGRTTRRCFHARGEFGVVIIGDYQCQRCEYFRGKDETERTISCSHPDGHPVVVYATDEELRERWRHINLLKIEADTMFDEEDNVEGVKVWSVSQAKEIAKEILSMEKKKMTKAEAFGWLDGKKIRTEGNHEKVLRKLFDLGFVWKNLRDKRVDLGWQQGEVYGLTISDDEVAWWTTPHLFDTHGADAVSADDILSIEIVEEKYESEFYYGKAVELAKPLMHYLSETGHTEVISVCKEGISAIPMGTFLYKG